MAATGAAAALATALLLGFGLPAFALVPEPAAGAAGTCLNLHWLPNLQEPFWKKEHGLSTLPFPGLPGRLGLLDRDLPFPRPVLRPRELPFLPPELPRSWLYLHESPLLQVPERVNSKQAPLPRDCERPRLPLPFPLGAGAAGLFPDTA